MESRPYALTHCRFYTGYQQLDHHALIIADHTILALVPESQLDSTIVRMDGQGWAAAPGFLDLQLNGCGGVMFNDTITSQTLDSMHRTNLNSGTTSFLPTLITTTDEAMYKALEVVADYRRVYPWRVPGLHLEGPYLNPQRRGIHNGDYIRPADPAMVNQLVAQGPEVVRLITLAPEMVETSVIRALSSAGILVAAGHSEATFEQALAGFDAGIGMVTHLFNAMSPWLGRSPGLVGATLSQNQVYAGIIADGHHVHYGSIELAQRIKPERLILVSDATPPVGATLDEFMIGGQTVFYRQGRCISADGTLGGSALTMMAAVANAVRHGGIALEEALRMATLYPARAIGVDHSLGVLAPGYQANLVLFDPQELTVKATLDQGQPYFA